MLHLHDPHILFQFIFCTPAEDGIRYAQARADGRSILAPMDFVSLISQCLNCVCLRIRLSVIVAVVMIVLWLWLLVLVLVMVLPVRASGRGRAPGKLLRRLAGTIGIGIHSMPQGRALRSLADLRS